MTVAKKKNLIDEILTSLSKTLKGWQWRNLTLFGKIQILKTFAIPKFMFRASLICLTKNKIKQVNSIIYNFIWKGRDKIKRLALIRDYKDGGLRMPHILSSLWRVYERRKQQQQRLQVVFTALHRKKLLYRNENFHERNSI